MIYEPPNLPVDIKEHWMSTEEILNDLVRCRPLTYFWKYENRIDPTHFNNPRGIHGVGHTKRVLLLSQILAVRSGLDDREQEFLAVISLLHDIGRTNDGVDTRHGRLSFDKASGLGVWEKFRGIDQEMARYVMEMHCISDKEAYGMIGDYETDSRQAIKMLNFFKDSDGLDRVRIWDLDPVQLRIPIARTMVGLAERLFLNPDSVIGSLPR